MKKGLTSGFMTMIYAFIGLVLWTTLFSSIMSAFATLAGFTNIANYTVFSTIIYIAPTVLWIGGIFGAGFAYYKGYKAAETQGVNGLMETVLGALELILFITLFSTIMTSIDTIHNLAGISNYIALKTVIEISPAVLFLAGIFASVATGVSGIKSMRKHRKSAQS